MILNDSHYYHPDYDHAARYIVSPPLRPASGNHNQALKNALKSGLLDLVASDHCVFTTKDKRMGIHDFTKIPTGLNGLFTINRCKFFIGIEDRMNLLFDLMVSSGEMSPSDFVRRTSTEAAKIFNIYPKKGAIKVGADADIIIINPNATKIISAATHFQNLEYNVYEGRQIKGLVETTIARGRIVFQNGKMDCKPGSGRFLPTPAFGKMFQGLKEQKYAQLPTKIERTIQFD